MNNKPGKVSTKTNTAKEDSVEHKLKHRCALCPYSTKLLWDYKSHLVTHSSEKPFKCPECPYRTKRKGTLNKHVKNVHLLKSPSAPRPFPCPHSGCSFAAKVKAVLKQHLKIHSEEPREFSCSHPNCKYSTNRKGHLVEHTRIHSGEKPFVCQFESCSYAASNRSHLVSHTRTHTKERPFKCPEPNCEYSTGDSSQRKVHQLTHEPKEGEERLLFSCPLCEYSGKSKQLLSQHVKRHTLEKLFKCDEPDCSYEAKTKGNLKNHKLMHCDEKPFACSFESCEFCCKRKHAFELHLKTHSDERRYKCELCPFRGKTREVVANHLRFVHSGPNFRLFKCTESQCDYAAKRKPDLERHLLIHKSDKNYACSFPSCDFQTTTKYQVKSHEYFIHSDEKKEKCGICLFSCKTKSALTAHMRTHTKEEPYKCKENGCGYRAKQAGNLKRHVQRNHATFLKGRN